VTASIATKGHQPGEGQPAQDRWVVPVEDQRRRFGRGGAEVHGADEDGAAAGDQRPEARPDPAGPVQQQAGGDDRLDAQADGEGVDWSVSGQPTALCRSAWSRWWPSDIAATR
jgi:hypothetical protein